MRKDHYKDLESLNLVQQVPVLSYPTQKCGLTAPKTVASTSACVHQAEVSCLQKDTLLLTDACSTLPVNGTFSCILLVF